MLPVTIGGPLRLFSYGARTKSASEVDLGVMRRLRWPVEGGARSSGRIPHEAAMRCCSECRSGPICLRTVTIRW